MSTCIKGLMDYNLIGKSSKEEKIPFQTNFHKNKSKKDGLQPNFETCVNQKQKTYVSKIEKKSDCYLKDYDKIQKHRIKNRRKKGMDFRRIEKNQNWISN